MIKGIIIGATSVIIAIEMNVIDSTLVLITIVLAAVLFSMSE